MSDLAERALAIIDRLRTDGHINNKEQGTLRRAILLPEKPQGEWITDYTIPTTFRPFSYQCSKCHLHFDFKYNFCPNCGMRGDNNG